MMWLRRLREWLRPKRTKGAAHYDPDGDCYEIFTATDVNFYGRWLRPGVTLYISYETGEVIGALIDGVGKRKAKGDGPA